MLYLYQESRISILLRTDCCNCEARWSWVYWWAWCCLKRPMVPDLTTCGYEALVRWQFAVRNKIFFGQNLSQCQIPTKNPTWIITELWPGLRNEKPKTSRSTAVPLLSPHNSDTGATPLLQSAFHGVNTSAVPPLEVGWTLTAIRYSTWKTDIHVNYVYHFSSFSQKTPPSQKIVNAIEDNNCCLPNNCTKYISTLHMDYTISEDGCRKLLRNTKKI